MTADEARPSSTGRSSEPRLETVARGQLPVSGACAIPCSRAGVASNHLRTGPTCEVRQLVLVPAVSEPRVGERVTEAVRVDPVEPRRTTTALDHLVDPRGRERTTQPEPEFRRIRVRVRGAGACSGRGRGVSSDRAAGSSPGHPCARRA